MRSNRTTFMSPRRRARVEAGGKAASDLGQLGVERQGPRVIAAVSRWKWGMTSVPMSSMVCMTASWGILYGLTRHRSRSMPASS